MPTILPVKGYQFYFYAHDVMTEPPHVHVAKAEADCKFWFRSVRLAVNHGFRRHELLEVARIVEENQTQFLEKWNEFFRPAS